MYMQFILFLSLLSVQGFTEDIIDKDDRYVMSHSDFIAHPYIASFGVDHLTINGEEKGKIERCIATLIKADVLVTDANCITGSINISWRSKKIASLKREEFEAFIVKNKSKFKITFNLKEEGESIVAIKKIVFDKSYRTEKISMPENHNARENRNMVSVHIPTGKPIAFIFLEESQPEKNTAKLFEDELKIKSGYIQPVDAFSIKGSKSKSNHIAKQDKCSILTNSFKMLKGESYLAFFHDCDSLYEISGMPFISHDFFLGLSIGGKQRGHLKSESSYLSAGEITNIIKSGCELSKNCVNYGVSSYEIYKSFKDLSEE